MTADRGLQVGVGPANGIALAFWTMAIEARVAGDGGISATGALIAMAAECGGGCVHREITTGWVSAAKKDEWRKICSKQFDRTKHAPEQCDNEIKALLEG
jgi:hypothetical protein